MHGIPHFETFDVTSTITVALSFLQIIELLRQRCLMLLSWTQGTDMDY
jgi:hypothetical protein